MRSEECGRLVDAIDWERTPLGDRARWPAALRSMVANLLRSRQPMLLFWGPELVQFYNDAFVPSFGRGKHPAAMGQPAAECWKDAWPIVGAQIEAVMRDGEPAWHTDALVPIHRNGRLEEVFWNYSYSPAHGDDGEIAGTLVICTEITGRVVSARRLAALAGLGAAIADATRRDAVLAALAPIVEAHPTDLPFLLVVEHDPDGCGELLAAMGLDAPIASRTADAIGLSRSPSPREVALAEPIPGRPWPEPIERVWTAPLPTGAGPARVSIVFGISPRLPFDDGYRSYLQQIVDQLAGALQRIEHAEAWRVVEEQRDDLLQHAPVATALLVGPTHRYQLANPRYRQMVGRDPTGKTFVEAFPELAGSPTHATFDAVYRSGQGHVANEQRVRLERGGVTEDRWFNFAIEALRAPDGGVYGLMIVAVDVSEQVRASRAKDEFLAMLGHELRNPLAPIAAAIELMKRKDPGSSHEQDTIERQLRHVTRLVDDLLDVSRITRGTIALARRPLAVAAFIKSAVEMARGAIDLAGHSLEVDVAADLFVDGDAARLTQVVTNLLTNAARYTPPGGSIRVRAEADGDRVVLRVIDDGRGIDAELIDHVFDLFVQGKRGPDRAEGGLGIGLAVVKNLVTLHGGSVVARSEGPGKGTEVTVTLPRAAAPDASADASTARAELPTTSEKKRVLVVDDNEDAAMLLGELLRSCGHDAMVAHDPMTALRMITESAPDIAVLDIGLPGMDGYELAARIRELPAACRLIALTGYGQESDYARTREAGFEAHFVKPVELGRFLSALV
jgi:signal transduction histidine kinase/CheY-like chemotaxis protein